MQPRSFHFVPAHKPQLFERLGQLGADRCIFDLEDAVPPSEKAAARACLEGYLAPVTAGRYWVRIHEVGHAEFEHDAVLLRRWEEMGVVVPKFSSAEDLAELERRIGIKHRAVCLLVESFEAVWQVSELLDQGRMRPYAVGLGFEDMLASVPHAARDLTELLRHIRTTLALACRARGVIAIDGISGAEEDDAVFERHCLESRACGMHGKFSIHPRQIAPINRILGPAPEQIRWAERIANLTGLRDDFGYEKIEGLVITPPKIKKARYILGSQTS